MVDVTTPMPREILPAILAKAAVRSSNAWARVDSNEGRDLLVIDAITPVPESRRFCNQPARESTLDGKVRRDSITIENK